MKKTILALSLAVLLSACSDDKPSQPNQPGHSAPPVREEPIQQQAAVGPVIINQAPAQAGSSTGDMLAAGAIGYMAGQALSNNNSRGYDRDYDRRPVVHRTTVIKKTIIQQPKKQIAYAYKPTNKKVSLTKSYRSSSSKRR